MTNLVNLARRRWRCWRCRNSCWGPTWRSSPPPKAPNSRILPTTPSTRPPSTRAPRWSRRWRHAHPATRSLPLFNLLANEMKWTEWLPAEGQVQYCFQRNLVDFPFANSGKIHANDSSFNSRKKGVTQSHWNSLHSNWVCLFNLVYCCITLSH